MQNVFLGNKGFPRCKGRIYWKGRKNRPLQRRLVCKMFFFATKVWHAVRVEYAVKYIFIYFKFSVRKFDSRYFNRGEVDHPVDPVPVVQPKNKKL